MTGVLKSKESNLSKKPPCPGINTEESFTAESRLSKDSTKSPICPAIPIITPVTIALGRLKKSRTINFAKIKVSTEKVNPKIAPSQLLLGLTRGNNLCLPKTVPP